MKKTNSKTAVAKCSSEAFFDYITDLRNFEQFLPADFKGGWEASESLCTLRVMSLGKVNIEIKEKIPSSKVIFSGNAISRIDFILEVSIAGSENNFCSVSLTLITETDTFTNMLISPGIERLLETLTDEIESFSGWQEGIIRENPLP
ncbi:MAG TPA: hypothetical protein PLN06_06610 [Bacteroidales bacterium]|nr:hypothetical protein [Bacteroidales bacterium]HCI54389.1 hypothetical protein [Bacteroidales bacterium]HOU96281.1 hypothetical protein [Bacteroidales bacterium]HQG36474.1 hypothetical protein [Bacteroidales bacterium]HQG52553.1 hypothetical protein [Bacteroidales bacterium]